MTKSPTDPIRVLTKEGDRLVLPPLRHPLVVESGLLVFQGRLRGEVPDHREVRDQRLERLAEGDGKD